MRVTPLFTVAIATHGPARYLPAVLAGLARQSERRFETLIVDNNQVSRFQLTWAPAPFGQELLLHVVHEPAIGLCVARNAAVKRAIGRYIAFIDDDAVPDPDWLSELASGMFRYQCAGAGGTVRLALPEGLESATLSPKVRSFLSELAFGGRDLDDIGEAYIVGANMCFARDVFDRVGLFSERLGHDKSVARVRFNDEIEMCRRLRQAGEKVSFLARARVWHQVPRRRLSPRYLLTRAYWQGRSDAWLTSIPEGRAIPNSTPSAPSNGRLAAFKRMCHRIRRRRGFDGVLNLASELGYMVQVCLNARSRLLARF